VYIGEIEPQVNRSRLCKYTVNHSQIKSFFFDPFTGRSFKLEFDTFSKLSFRELFFVETEGALQLPAPPMEPGQNQPSTIVLKTQNPADGMDQPQSSSKLDRDLSSAGYHLIKEEPPKLPLAEATSKRVRVPRSNKVITQKIDTQSKPKTEISKVKKIKEAVNKKDNTTTTAVKNWFIPETLEAFLRLSLSVDLGKKTTRAMQELLELMKADKTAERLRREHIRKLKIMKVKVPKEVSKAVHSEHKFITVLMDIYRRLKNSFKIALRTLKFNKILTRFDSAVKLQNKKNRNIPESLLGILSFFGDVFKRIRTRGVIDGIALIGEFSFECEGTALRSMSDGPLLRKYFRGEIQRTRTNRKALALLATLRRAMPAITDTKSIRKALNRTIKGICGPSNETAQDVLDSIKQHVIKFCKYSRPKPLNTETGFTSLGSCFENPRSKGGSYSYIHECKGKFKSIPPSKKGTITQIREVSSSNLLDSRKLLSQWATVGYTETATPLNPRAETTWDQTVKKLYMVDSNKPAKVKLSVIPQTGARYRTASIHEAAITALIGPACDQVTDMLKNYGPTESQFAADYDKILERVKKIKLKENENIYSTDLSQASDLMNKDALYCIVNTLAEELKWPLVVKKAVLKSVQPTEVFVSKSDLSESSLDKGQYKMVGVTTNGSLLGAPLSFCLMTILHAWCLKAISKRTRKGAVLFGDDATILGTERDWNKYCCRLDAVGFQVNKKKTHVSKEAFIFCGFIYDLKIGRLTPCKLSRLVEIKENWIHKIDLFNSSCEGLLDWQAARAIRSFKRNESGILKEFVKNNIPLQTPRELGGLGLARSKHPKYTLDDRLIASIILTANNRHKEVEIVRRFTKPFVQAYLPEEARGIVENIYNATAMITFDPAGVATYKEVLQSLLGHELYKWFLSSYRDTRSIDKKISPRNVAENLWFARNEIIRAKEHKFQDRFLARNDKINAYIKFRNQFTISNDSLLALEIGTQSFHSTVSGVVRYSPLSGKVNRLGRKPNPSTGQS
jgi:hypothetical protein